MRPAMDHKQRTLGDARAILESITDAFFSVNNEWIFNYLNPQAEKILGREPDDLLGKSLWEVFPGLAGSEFEKTYRKAASNRLVGRALPDDGGGRESIPAKSAVGGE